MKKKYGFAYIPSEVQCEITEIKTDMGITSNAEAFRQLARFAKIGKKQTQFRGLKF